MKVLGGAEDGAALVARVRTGALVVGLDRL